MDAGMLFDELYEIGARRIGNGDYPSSLPIKLVHRVGGGEGQGEYAERVYEHDNDGEMIYFKITGFYSSYDGTDWDSDIQRVTPQEKTITVYVKY